MMRTLVFVSVTLEKMVDKGGMMGCKPVQGSHK